jgi:hypothetical protein
MSDNNSRAPGGWAGKNPAFLFYPGDWERDLDEHPLEIEGAWIRICCKLWWSETRGSASKTLDQWSRVLRVTPKKTERILEYLSQHSIATLVKQNLTITITSSRMVRDEHIRTVRKEAGSKGGNPALKSSVLLNQTDNQKPTLSVSVSSSVSKKDFFSPSDFDTFWNLYPKRNGRKAGKAECLDWCQHRLKNGDGALLLQAVKNYAASKEAKEGFARDPIRFLKKDFWRDFVSHEPGKGPGYFWDGET